MARLTRVFQKIFASNAINNGQFGSAQLGTKLLTNDPATIQALAAYENGWDDAIIGAKRFPAEEEVQSLTYLETRQLAYIFQEGIVEYDAQTEYFQNSIVRKAGTYELYGSIIDNNIGNALPVGVSDSNWQFLIDLSLQNALAYGVSTNSGNDYSVTTSPTITTFPVGLPLLVKFNAANTGAVTLNANATSAITVLANGVAMIGGEIKANTAYLLIYDGAVFHLVGANAIYADNAQTIAGILADRAVTPASLAALTSTVLRRGLVELATSPETIAGADTDRAITPSGLLSAFDQQKLASGYLKIIGGIIIQWGRVTTSGGVATWVYPTNFTSQVFITLASNDSDDAANGVGITPTTLSVATVKSTLTSAPDGVWCFAIGV